MKNPINNDERLSALLEGRLSDDERKELMAHLAASEDEFEVLTDTAEILIAAEEEDERAAAASKAPLTSVPDDKREGENPAREMTITAAGEQEGVIPLRPARRGPRLPVWWLGVAATVVGVVVISTLALPRGGSSTFEPTELAMRVDPAKQGLPADWTAPTQSGGRGAAGSVVDSALAVYAGAMLVDISVAAQAGDANLVKRRADRLLGRAMPSASAAIPLQRIAGNPGAATEALLALVDQATDGLADELEPRLLELGAWTEAARLAARRQGAHGEAFFRDRATDAMLARAERVAGGDEAARDAVKGVRTALRRSPLQWDALEGSVTALQTALTN